ncbi:ABC transporter ATP-binding protein [Variovorax terrae]|uniref:ABC transporter ATP-binding protein n=1 Tax=Variovorax terrae TaxID=2923278 RepID=A0A9X1W156_9BURK|nr:ABC transporter ATP-binding protein [Variovorax terrae]MCJ0765899.1 ABC transporter ATP-binding protein [Variovorax terrae]
MNPTILKIDGLTTEFETRAGRVVAVNGVSLSVKQGEILGLVGESGSGKSQTGYSIMNLVDRPGRITGGSILLNGTNLLALSESEWRHIRGKRIAMVFQDPMLTLNPVLRIDTQMIETVQAHAKVSRSQAREIARACLVKVGIAAPDERLKSYPHQFSGGMRQRVAIAIALVQEPEVLIADEPTTALDVTIQEQILYEMQQLARQSGTAMIWITHDLSVVAGLADRVAVMYAGRIIERGLTRDVLSRPTHPYTVGLLRSVPARNPRGSPLFQIPGAPPNLLAQIDGCAFRARCTQAGPRCTTLPPVQQSPNREVRCFYPVMPLQESVAA